MGSKLTAMVVYSKYALSFRYGRLMYQERSENKAAHKNEMKDNLHLIVAAPMAITYDPGELENYTDHATKQLGNIPEQCIREKPIDYHSFPELT